MTLFHAERSFSLILDGKVLKKFVISFQIFVKNVAIAWIRSEIQVPIVDAIFLNQSPIPFIRSLNHVLTFVQRLLKNVVMSFQIRDTNSPIDVKMPSNHSPIPFIRLTNHSTIVSQRLAKNSPTGFRTFSNIHSAPSMIKFNIPWKIPSSSLPIATRISGIWVIMAYTAKMIPFTNSGIITSIFSAMATITAIINSMIIETICPIFWTNIMTS